MSSIRMGRNKTGFLSSHQLVIHIYKHNNVFTNSLGITTSVLYYHKVQCNYYILEYNYKIRSKFQLRGNQHWQNIYHNKISHPILSLLFGLRSDPTHSLQARKSSWDKSGFLAPTLRIEGLFNG
jgi:hypothetical protein